MSIKQYIFKKRITNLPVTLKQNEIYILPNKYGLIYLLVLIALLLYSINYNNNLGFFLTFILASMFFISIFHTFINIKGLEISSIKVDSVFAGEKVPIHIQLYSGHQNYKSLIIATNEIESKISSLPEESFTHVKVFNNHKSRGIWKIDFIKVYTEYPFGLFKAWSTLNINLQYLVFPAPAHSYNHLNFDSGTGQKKIIFSNKNKGDEFNGLRTYIPGDSMQRIAWKASSKGMGILTKSFDSEEGQNIIVRWDDLKGETEHKLSIMCKMILDAEKQSIPYRMELPGRTITQGKGKIHMLNCLSILARYEDIYHTGV